MKTIFSFLGATLCVFFAGCPIPDLRPLSAGTVKLGDGSGVLEISAPVELAWILVVLPDSIGVGDLDHLTLLCESDGKTHKFKVARGDLKRTSWLQEYGYDDSYRLLSTKQVMSMVSSMPQQIRCELLPPAGSQPSTGFQLWAGYSKKGIGGSRPVKGLPASVRK